jgi:hypothetical protein
VRLFVEDFGCFVHSISLMGLVRSVNARKKKKAAPSKAFAQ